MRGAFKPPRGDRLWVREAYRVYESGIESEVSESVVLYKTNYDDRRASEYVWMNPMFMPRRYSRITLEVTNVRCERLMSMWHCHAEKEGYGAGSDSIQLFREAWDKLNAKRGYGWETNPWVWVMEFKRLNI